MSDKVRENRLRRMAERQGLILEKSRRRDRRALGFGKYRLVTDSRQRVDYTHTMDDVERILLGLDE